MELRFLDSELEAVYITGTSKQYNKDIILGFIKKIDLLKSISDEKDLYIFKSLNFEKLTNYKYGDYSVRINQKRRIIFNIDNEEVKIISVTQLSNHYM